MADRRLDVQGFSRIQGVFQQAGAGHRAYATRNRRDPARAGQGGFVHHIAYQLAVSLTVYADVDHDGAFLDPLALDQSRLAGGHDHQVCTTYMDCQILGETVGNGDRAAREQQLHRHWAPNNVGRAHDHCIQPVEIDPDAFQQGHDAFRGAGAQQRYTLGQTTDVIRMETVNILVRANALQQLRGVEVFWQRQLQQDAVDVRIAIEAIDQIGQGVLAGFCRQVIGLRDKADFFTVFALVRDVNLGGRIAADQNHREARCAQAL